MKKIITIALLFTIVVTVSFSPLIIQASESNDTGEIDFNRYEYVHSSIEYSTITDYSHHASNAKGVVSEVEFDMGRTVLTTALVSTGEIFDVMVTEVGLPTEVVLGVNTTKTVSVKWGIPANWSGTLDTGSRVVKTTGTVKHWVDGVVKSSEPVTGTWTYQTWNNWYSD